jgi:hypothetical protein
LQAAKILRSPVLKIGLQTYICAAEDGIGSSVARIGEVDIKEEEEMYEIIIERDDTDPLDMGSRRIELVWLRAGTTEPDERKATHPTNINETRGQT